MTASALRSLAALAITSAAVLSFGSVDYGAGGAGLLGGPDFVGTDGAGYGPSYCYSMGHASSCRFPSTPGTTRTGRPPFNGPGPSYGGGNHRWPDGTDH